ncbi:MAG: hypothetical protein WBV22_02395 [Anaerolineaceae bacterium]
MKKGFRILLVIGAILVVLTAISAFALRGTGIPTVMRRSALKLLSHPQPGPAMIEPERINICPATRELEEFSESLHLSTCDDDNTQFKALYSGESYRWVPNDGIYYNEYVRRVLGSQYSVTHWHATGRLVLFLDGPFTKTDLNIGGVDFPIPDGKYTAPEFGMLATGIIIRNVEQVESFYIHDYNKDLKIDRVAVGWVDPYDFMGRMKCGILGQANGQDIEAFEYWAEREARSQGGEIERRTCWTDSNEGGYDFDFNDFVFYFVILPLI